MQRSLSVNYSNENRYETSPQNILHDALAELETNRTPKLRTFSSRSIKAQQRAQSYLRLSAQRIFPRDSVQFLSQFPNAKERVSTLLEIVESQRTYVKFLKMIKEVYYLPMVLGRDDHKKNNFDKPGIPYSECIKMFPRSFTKILASDEILLSKMEERLKLYNSDDYYFAMIGDIFIQFAEFFKKYSEYMIEYEACTTVFRKHRESSLRFQHWLSRRRRICDFDIMSLLVMPVQRTTRQKMLLEKLLVATDASHGEYDILVDAVECMKELAAYQNESIRTVSNVKQIEEFANLLKIENLVDADRRFLIKGSAYINDEEHQVYLFSDSIFFQHKKVTHYILKKLCISGGTKYSILLSHDDFGDFELFFDTYQEKCQWLGFLEVSIRNSRKSWKIPTFVYQQVSIMDMVGRFVKWWTLTPAMQEQMAVSPGSLSITL